jgi:hypothetical protein
MKSSSGWVSSGIFVYEYVARYLTHFPSLNAEWHSTPPRPNTRISSGARYVTSSINLNFTILYSYYGAFTLDVKLLLNENLGGILGVTQCKWGDSLMLSEC